MLEAAQPSWLTWAPPGTSNHILWHAGHALWLQDALCVEPLVRKSELPQGWRETFGMNCRPVAATRSWPDRHEVVQLLLDQLQRILQLFEEHSAALASNPLANLEHSPRGHVWQLPAVAGFFGGH